MKGWKTNLGAIMAALGAVVGMYNGTTDIGTGITVIGAALSTLGLRHAFSKAVALVLDQIHSRK